MAGNDIPAPRVLAGAALFAMAIVLGARPAALLDPDLWWHLRTGQWILEHAGVPRTDPFSIYGATRHWVAYTWLFDLLLYGFHALGGLAGISMFVCLLWLAFAYSVFDLASSMAVSPWRAIGATGLCLIAIRGFATPRPWLASMVLLVLELKILFQAFRGKTWRQFWCLPPIFMLWANLHIQFTYGLFAATVLLAFSKVPAGLAATVLLLSWAATLLNPYGLDVYRVALDYAGQGSLSSIITELWHPDPREWSTWLVVAITVWAAFSLASRGRASLSFWPLLIAAVILYLRTRRDAWFLAIVATALVLDYTSPIRDLWLKRTTQRAALFGSLAGAVLAAAHGGFRSERLNAALRSEYPVEAVQHIRTLNLPGPLLNTFDWGGYLIWHLPSIPVSIDGRTNVHPARRVLAFYRLWHGDLAAVPEFETARLIIAPAALPLTVHLRQDARFSVAYQDASAAVFVRAR